MAIICVSLNIFPLTQSNLNLEVKRRLNFNDFLWQAKFLKLQILTEYVRLEGIPPPFPFLRHLQAINLSFVTILDFLYLGYPLSLIFLSWAETSVPWKFVWPSGYCSLFISNTLKYKISLDFEQIFWSLTSFSLYISNILFPRVLVHYKINVRFLKFECYI